jgi:hypothetical protein
LIAESDQGKSRYLLDFKGGRSFGDGQPSLSRVAPLAQSLRGQHQFFSTKKQCPKWLRKASVIYYVLLKTVSMLVYFGFPAWAFLKAFTTVVNFPVCASPKSHPHQKTAQFTVASWGDPSEHALNN